MGLFRFLFGGRSAPTTAPAVKSPPLSESAAPEAGFVIHLSEAEIRCERPDGRTERVAWHDLEAVIIETTSDGPFAPDVFWILAGSSPDSGCMIPQDYTDAGELLKRLQQLPGFDNKAFIDAMGCTDDRRFVCWKRSK